MQRKFGFSWGRVFVAEAFADPTVNKFDLVVYIVINGVIKLKWNEEILNRRLRNWTEFTVAASKDTVAIVGGIIAFGKNPIKSRNIWAHNFYRPAKFTIEALLEVPRESPMAQFNNRGQLIVYGGKNI